MEDKIRDKKEAHRFETGGLSYKVWDIAFRYLWSDIQDLFKDLFNDLLEEQLRHFGKVLDKVEL